MTLHDEEDRPIVDEPVELIDAGSGRYPRRTDQDGLVRVDRVEAGICEVRFPRMDGREWERRRRPFPEGTDAVREVHVVGARQCMAWIAKVPFAIVSAQTKGLTRAVESSEYVFDVAGGDWGWRPPIIEAPVAPDAPLHRQSDSTTRNVPRVSFDAHGIWLETRASNYLQTERLTRRTLWRAGDPWFAITEALDEHGHPSQARTPPARFRLIEIDGERIEPVPWSEGHRR